MSPRLVNAGAELAHRWRIRPDAASFIVEHLGPDQLDGAARLVARQGWSAERAVSWMRACWKLGLEAGAA